MRVHTPKTDLPLDAGEDLRFVIVQAMFNDDITDAMVAICKAELVRLGVAASDVYHERVPGALELPVVLKWSEAHYQPSAMIAIGCVIRGDTYHFEVVATQSANAVMNLSLSSDDGRGMGIANGIITCNTHEQALTRVSPVALSSAHTAILMAQLKEKLDSHI